MPMLDAAAPNHSYRLAGEPEELEEEQDDEIERQMEARVRAIVAAGPEAIEARLKELDEEWDIEKKLRVNAATLSLVGVGLGFFLKRKIFIIPGIVTGLILQYALQGWTPSPASLRRRGFRTLREIEHERHALKMLRGDYDLPPVEDSDLDAFDEVDHALEAARR